MPRTTTVDAAWFNRFDSRLGEAAPNPDAPRAADLVGDPDLPIGGMAAGVVTR